MKTWKEIITTATMGLLLAGASVGHAASLQLANDHLGNGNVKYKDVWRVQCAAQTTIRANVQDRGPIYDNTFHVYVTCINPASGTFRVAKSFATDGRDQDGDANGYAATNPSSYAPVAGCRDAFVTFSCEANDWCDDAYNGRIECVNTAITSATKVHND
jgi:hypothetical protein